MSPEKKARFPRLQPPISVLRGLRAALQYFTAIPLQGTSEDAPPSTGLFLFLPPIGCAVGAVAGAAAYGVSKVAPFPLAVAVAFGLSIGLTGALHLDGFMDSCDALFASVPAERRREILKDPHHGTFAIASFAVLAVFWLAALASIPPLRLPLVMAYAAGLGRWAAILNATLRPYRGIAPSRPALATEGILLAGLGVAAGGHAWIAFPLVVAFALAGGAWASRRMGGVLSGDLYGALIASGEVVGLVVCALAGR